MAGLTDQLASMGRDPVTPVDPDRLWQRARRRRTGWTAASLMCLIGVLVAGLRLLPADSGPTIGESPPACPPLHQLLEVEGNTIEFPAGGLAGAVMFMPRDRRWEPGENMKMAVKAQGNGPLQMVAIGPDDRRVAPTSEPSPVLSSNWGHPGDEFHTVLAVPTAGCWKLTFTRDGQSTSLPVTVAKPAE